MTRCGIYRLVTEGGYPCDSIAQSEIRDSSTDYYFMGVAGVALDRSEQARAAQQKALNIDPAGSVRAHVHLASLLIKENCPQEAAREVEIYLKAVPNPFDGEKLRALLSQLQAGSKP
jgi:tetratricopeptide (TPR) repeat protein